MGEAMDLGRPTEAGAGQQATATHHSSKGVSCVAVTLQPVARATARTMQRARIPKHHKTLWEAGDAAHSSVASGVVN